MRAESRNGASEGSARGSPGWGRFAVAAGVLGLLAAVIAWQAAAAAAGVLKVRFGGDQAETRMVIELDSATSARVLADGDGDRRLVLRFDKISAAGMDGKGRGLVGAWSLDRSSRLTLDLTRNARIVRRFLLPPSDGVPAYRYVIDLAADGGAAERAPPPQPAPAAQARFGLDQLVEASLRSRPAAEAKPIRLKRVIVIDAGHGGHDPGALGATSREKNVTLAAALALKKRLERNGRYRVVLTRSTDTFVPLETRVQIAREANADLFISLHADSAGDPQTRGATVYTLSEQGTDRAAKRVFSGGSFIDVDLPGRDRSVKQILLDLTQRATKNQSGAFAELLLSSIADDTPLLRRSHRDAGFVVLLAPDVPAVLMEMGFMSSPADEANLNSSSQRARLMDAVGDSIDEYFADQLRYASN
jgi:N-acetylmuramoyl-L-alanine amidase